MFGTACCNNNTRQHDLTASGTIGDSGEAIGVPELAQNKFRGPSGASRVQENLLVGSAPPGPPLGSLQRSPDLLGGCSLPEPHPPLSVFRASPLTQYIGGFAPPINMMARIRLFVVAHKCQP